MKVQLFALRHQALGVLPTTVYATAPTDAALAAIQPAFDRLAPAAPPGSPWWLRAHPIVLDLDGLTPEAAAALARHLAPLPLEGEHAASSAPPEALPPARFTATVTLTPPES